MRKQIFAGLLLVCTTIGLAGQSIPLEILEPKQRTGPIKDFPASVGMIFVKGELPKAPGGSVMDDLGNAIPFDWEITGWWSPEKTSVKWLRLHFKASSDRKYSFVVGAEPTTKKGEPLASETGDAIAVNTGPLAVQLRPGNAPIFESVELNGQAIITPGGSFFEMTDDEGRELSCRDWTLTLEENTALRAVVRAEGIVGLPGAKPLAKLDIRYHFFVGEGFVRIQHTFIWMEQSLDPGLSRIGLRLRPQLDQIVEAQVGLSDYTAAAQRVSIGPKTDLSAYQDTAERFVIRRDEQEIATGKHLGGWIAVEGAKGRGVGVSLKNAWQTYPTTLSVREGEIDIGLWPEEAGRFSFEERDIMPDSLYYSRYWAHQVSWTKQGGPTWFNTRDLDREFVNALREPSAVAKHIVEFLRPELQTGLRNEEKITDGFRARIAHAMNAFLGNREFYDETAWQDVELKPKTKELLAKGVANLNRGELVWLNRLLIESAFRKTVSPSDIPHFIHENALLLKRGGYRPGGRGAARTHELTLHFFDKSSRRTTAQLNSLTQHPFVLRQSPAHALRAPILGFKLSPTNPDKHPEIERALHQYGRASFSRYAETHDYGFHRFGMQRMNFPGQALYRWTAGMQYDQQLIPWLLFIRGGDRLFYEEAMNTATYAIDMHVNHYNANGPTGYMSFVAGMPMPQGATFSAYNMKIHFVQLCHHLTGYRRAREVTDMAIAGVKKVYPGFLQRSIPVTRQLYGMDLFCAHAWEETFDPRMKELARASLDHTLKTHYDPVSNRFAGNTQYLYRGLLGLYRLFPEPEFRQLMLNHLRGRGLPESDWAGPIDNRSAIPLIASAWAYEQTGDQRYARTLWDITRTIADTAPDHDWSTPEIAEYPLGHFAAYCHRVLPMLVGLGLVENNQLNFPDTSGLHDLFVAVNQPGSTGEIFIRSLKDGDLTIKLKANPPTDRIQIEMTAHSTDTNQEVATTSFRGRTEQILPDLRTTTFLRSCEGSLTIPNTRKGQIYRLTTTGGDRTTGILALADNAQVVHRIQPGTIQFYGHSYQYYLGSRVFVKTKADTLRITRNRPRAGFTIRDAQTHEILAHNKVLDPLTTEHHVGKNRLLELVLGAGRDTIWTLEEIEPFVSARLTDWFSPSLRASW